MVANQGVTHSGINQPGLGMQAQTRQTNRAQILQQLERPDVFQAVLVNEPSELDSAEIRDLRTALQQEPLRSEEVFGDEHEHRPENPRLRANFYTEFARQFTQGSRRAQQRASQVPLRQEAASSTDLSPDYDPPVLYPDGSSSGTSTPAEEQQQSLLRRIITRVFHALAGWLGY